MFQNLGRSFRYMIDITKSLFKYPELFVPVLLTWLIMIFVELHTFVFLNLHELSDQTVIQIAFGRIFLYSILLTSSCIALLVMIKNLESQQPPQLLKALRLGITQLRHFWLLSLGWAIIWFLGWLLNIIVTTLIRNRLARTTAQTAISAFLKTIRMLVFLSLPGIIWEKLSASEALNKGLTLFRQHSRPFASGFAMSEMVGFFIFIPLAIVSAYYNWSENTISPFVTSIIFLYSLIMFSYLTYLEQMFTTEIYLRHLKWTKAKSIADANGQPRPSFIDIPSYSLLDNNYEFNQNILSTKN